MFIYSMKASTLKFFSVMVLCVIALVTLIAFIPNYDTTVSIPISSAVGSEAGISFDKIKTNEDRIAFLGQFGWLVSQEPVEEAEITIPAEFDRVFTGYNELQKKQGLDLSKYKRKGMTRYTYEVTNYDGYDGRVLANVIVYRNKVVGGDISSADVNGFVHGFDRNIK